MSRTFTNDSPGGLHGWAAWHVRSALMLLAVGAAMVAASVTMAAELPGKGAKVVACTSLSLEGLFKEIIVLKGLEKLGFTLVETVFYEPTGRLHPSYVCARPDIP